MNWQRGWRSTGVILLSYFVITYYFLSNSLIKNNDEHNGKKVLKMITRLFNKISYSLSHMLTRPYIYTTRSSTFFKIIAVPIYNAPKLQKNFF